MNAENQKIEKTSSYCYPVRDEEYAKYVENIDDKSIRLILKTILLTGFRFGEVINGYYFLDADGNLFFRSIATKAKKIKIVDEKEHQTKFLGVKRLHALLNLDYWKSVKCVNIFNLNLDEIIEIAEQSSYEKPKFLAEFLDVKTWKNAFCRLKNFAKEVKVKYRKNENEAGHTRYYIPSFHFYRKLFATKFYHATGKDFLAAVDYMRWKKLQTMLKYIKEYE